MDWDCFNNKNIDFDTISALSRKLDILKVLDYYDIEAIEMSMGRHKSVCPFHDDHDPSLIVFTENEDEAHSFCCFPCDKAGDPFEFIRGMEEEVRGRSFKDSVSVLKRLSGFVDKEQGNLEHAVNDILEDQRIKSSDIKNMIDSLHYGLSIYYRDYLNNIREESNYKQECKEVDKRFKEIDKFFSNKELTYEQAIKFYDEELERKD